MQGVYIHRFIVDLAQNIALVQALAVVRWSAYHHIVYCRSNEHDSDCRFSVETGGNGIGRHRHHIRSYGFFQEGAKELTIP